MRGKIRPFVQEKMKVLLGEVDQDLVAFVLEHLKERKSVDALVDGLEPVCHSAPSPLTNRSSPRMQSRLCSSYGASWPSKRPRT
jgi:hypothetical protein